jgi:peptide/nickel transport system substrate-binding protein
MPLLQAGTQPLWALSPRKEEIRMSARVPIGLVLCCTITAALAGCSADRSDDSSGPTAGDQKGQQAKEDDAGPSRPASDDPKIARLERRDQTLGGVKPAANDTLLMTYAQDPDTINALTANDNVSDAFQRQVYESLGSADYTDPDNILPGLATHWEFDKEKLEFTIHLRRGVKWHPMKLPDGKELPQREFTARDVKFTFDCVLNPNVEAASLRSYFEDPETKSYKIKVTVIDDYTVKVRWTKPYFLAKEFTLGAVPIIPRHVYSVDKNGEPISLDFASKEFADGFNDHWANRLMCGTGPLMFKEWTRENRLVLVRNPDYWGAPYYFSQTVFRCIPNPNTSTQQVLQQELDFAAIAEKDRYVQIKDHPNVRDGKVVRVAYEYPGYRYIGYNLRRELFKDKELRRAMAYATPVQQIIDEVFQGLAVPVTGPFLPGSSACDPSIKPIPFDLGKARQILDEAGWKDTDENGIRDKVIKGVKTQASFDLMIFSDAPSFRTVGEIFQENCRKIGVEVKLSPAKWALMLQKLRKFDFDAAMLGWGTSWSKGDPFQLWHGSQADVQDGSNHVGYRNDQVDKLIDVLRVTMDEKEQVEICHKIHRLIYDDQPYTFLFSEKATGARDARLQNIRFYRLRPCTDSREWFSNRPRTFGQTAGQ